MSDAVQIALITGLVASIPAIGAVLIAWWSMQAKQAELKLETAKLNAKQDELKTAQDELKKNADVQVTETKELHKTVNSRMDDLLAASKQASKAEGKVEERTEQTAKAMAVMESQKRIANGGHDPAPQGPGRATLVEVVNPHPVPVDVIEKKKP